VGGFPASGFTAFPVISGSSDYYGSSVAMPFYGFRQSPFSLIKTIAFRIVGYDFRHLHTTHGCSVLSIPQLYKMEIQLPRHCTFQLLSCRDKAMSRLWLSFRQSSFYPHIRIFILAIKTLVRKF